MKPLNKETPTGMYSSLLINLAKSTGKTLETRYGHSVPYYLSMYDRLQVRLIDMQNTPLWEGLKAKSK